MERITHTLTQGSESWHAFRADHFGASEAAACMGLSPYQSRSELLRTKATGEEKEVPSALQAVFDRGHETEIGGRRIAEKMLGEDLFPVVMSYGKESASCDGLTIGGETAFEHKQWSASLAASLRAGVLPVHHMPQVQQVIWVSGADRCLFMCSDGTEENCATMMIDRDDAYIRSILSAWELFEVDLAAYRPAEVIPAAIAAPINDLPALSIEISGSVVASNLTAWRGIVTERIASINTDLRTDQDFADADNMVKFLDDGEKRIDLAKAQAQSQATSIDEVFRALDDIKATMRAKRLELDRLVKARKESIRAEIVTAAKAAYEAHVEALKQETGGPWIVLPAPDFAGAIKSKRTVASLRDAVDTALAHGKIAADESAKKIRASLAYIKDEGAGFEFLFADKLALIGKPIDDLRLVIRTRIADHKAAEDKRLEAEREKIRAEEEAKARAKAEAEAKAARDAEIRAINEKRVAESTETVATPTAAPAELPSIAAAVPIPVAQAEYGVNRTIDSPAEAEAKNIAGSKLLHAVTGSSARTRPSDDDIIDVLALHYRVHESKVITWLLDMDLIAASERMAKEFAA